MATRLVDDRQTAEPLKDRSTAELLRRLSEQIRSLIQQEIRLAKAELTEKGKRAGKGAGMLAAAAVVGLYAIGVLLATIILALDTVMPTWLAALIVTVVLLVIAGILAMMGRSQARKATPAAPARTMESVKKDVQVMREHAHR